jgi:hypothetical protein
VETKLFGLAVLFELGIRIKFWISSNHLFCLTANLASKFRQILVSATLYRFVNKLCGCCASRQQCVRAHKKVMCVLVGCRICAFFYGHIFSAAAEECKRERVCGCDCEEFVHAPEDKSNRSNTNETKCKPYKMLTRKIQIYSTGYKKNNCQKPTI